MPKLSKYHSNDELKDCANCDARPVLVTEKQGENNGKTYWQGFIRCNRPSCGMRTPRRRSPERCIEIWNREPEE